MAQVQGTIQVFPFWRVILCGLIVVGFCSILCWWFGWCWWCPDCPDLVCGDEEAQIIVEDMHGSSVWMAFENDSFDYYVGTHVPTLVCTDTTKSAWGTCDSADYETAYRHGVLFQMGYAVDSSGATKQTQGTNFGGVYIKHDSGEEWLLPGVRNSKPFDWLDVREGDSKCVVGPKTAYGMFMNPTAVTTDCDPLPTTDPAYRCSRVRSMHASVEAWWLMTFWAGPEDYEMVAGETDEKTIVLPDLSTQGPVHGPSHVSYTFQLPKMVVVDRWLAGCHEEQYTGVTEIRLLYNDTGNQHLGYPHLPMNGKN